MEGIANSSGCPVCGFDSLYTEGDSPCSVRCALTRTMRTALPPGLTIEYALDLVRDEAKNRGLPFSPDVRDGTPQSYLLIRVSSSMSELWRLDRLLIFAGINVEYMWVQNSHHAHDRIYRLPSNVIHFLPEEVQDYPQYHATSASLYKLAGGIPYWHFLPSRERPT